MTDVGTPWLLRGRTGTAIGKWLDRRGWELHRVVYADGIRLPVARVRVRLGQEIRAADITDVQVGGAPVPTTASQGS